jgi:hypothetical protein
MIFPMNNQWMKKTYHYKSDKANYDALEIHV